jgi:hypothetical protein
MRFWRLLGASYSAALHMPPQTASCSDVKAPIIIQVSQGGAAYFAGKGLANDKQQASITGAIAAALHVRTVAKAYGVYAVGDRGVVSELLIT